MELIRSGLDCVVWFNCSIEECLRRADGRRVDSAETGPKRTDYHVDDRPPTFDKSPLCERLIHVEDDQNSTAGLIDRFVSFDQASKSLKAWFYKFGIKFQSGEEKHLICEIGAEGSDVTEKIKGAIDPITHFKDECREHAINLLMAHLQTRAEEKARQKQEEEARLVTHSDISPRGEREQVSARDVPVDPKSKPPVEQPVLSQEQVRNRIDNDFKPVIIQLWAQLETNYKRQMKKIFKNFRLHREQVITRRAGIQQRFLTFLHRNDGKQAILDEFVNRFNQFSDDFPDLREDDQTKEELHQRTDVFSDELWEIVEERKE